MFATSNAVSIPRLSAVVLVAALAMPFHATAQESGGLDVDVGVSLGGVNAGVDATVGGNRGLVDAKADVGIGGANGVNADVDANVGGSRGLVDADITASIGGSEGVNANANATVGGSRSLATVDVGATVGGSRGLGANTGFSPGGSVAGPDREVLRQFSQLSRSDRVQMIKRCQTVGSGGYDAALVKLCRLLQSASR